MRLSPRRRSGSFECEGGARGLFDDQPRRDHRPAGHAPGPRARNIRGPECVYPRDDVRGLSNVREARVGYSMINLDEIIDPLDTRRVLALGISAALNASIPETTFGVFRM